MTVADVAWPDVVAIDADLASIGTWAQDLYLAEANALNASAFDGEDGVRFRSARIFYAAHRGRRQLDVGSGVVGAVTAETIGRMSTSYAAPGAAAGADDFDTTRWGMAYLSLVRGSPAARLGGRRCR